VLAGSGADPAGRVAYVRTVQPGSDAGADDVTSHPASGHPAVHPAAGLQPAAGAVTSRDVSSDVTTTQHTLVVSADINTVSIYCPAVCLSVCFSVSLSVCVCLCDSVVSLLSGRGQQCIELAAYCSYFRQMASLTLLVHKA